MRGSIKEIIENLDDAKGEFIIIIEGNLNSNKEKDEIEDFTLDQLYEKIKSNTLFDNDGFPEELNFNFLKTKSSILKDFNKLQRKRPF